jgi:tripartite-type tricarboxylate transporter receptor subunit TctC
MSAAPAAISGWVKAPGRRLTITRFSLCRPMWSSIPALYPTVPYDPYRHFEPITIAVTSPIVLTVHPSLAVGSVRDLVALIKSNPGKYSFVSPGTGTPATSRR